MPEAASAPARPSVEARSTARSHATRLAGIEGRAAGTDAERRAAVLARDELRASGIDARLRTRWVRPFGLFAAWALLALLGAAASVASTFAPQVATGAAIAALALALAQAAGLVRLDRVLGPARATQDVVARLRGTSAPEHRVVVVAGLDAPRGGLTARLRPPLAAGVVVAGLAGVAAGAAARALDANLDLVGPLQLVPTVVLLAAAAAAFDRATSAAVAGTEHAAAAAVALSVAQALHRRTPRALGVDLLLGGAHASGRLGLHAALRERDDDATVLLVEPLGRGALRVAAGEVDERRAAEAAVGAERHLGAELTPRAAARLHGHPAVTVTTDRPGDPGEADPAPLDAAVELCLAVVAALDAQAARSPRAADG